MKASMAFTKGWVQKLRKVYLLLLFSLWLRKNLWRVLGSCLLKMASTQWNQGPHDSSTIFVLIFPVSVGLHLDKCLFGMCASIDKLVCQNKSNARGCNWKYYIYDPIHLGYFVIESRTSVFFFFSFWTLIIYLAWEMLP